MQTDLPQTSISCTQCGGELHPDQGQMFLNCPYCGSTVYLDKSRVVFHWYVAPTFDEPKARSSLARWMAGNDTVKDLDKKAAITGATFEYFPAWYFKRRLPGGKEQILLTPAAATATSEIRSIQLPAGDLRKYDDHLDPQAHAPTVPLQAALEWLEQERVPREQIVEQSLVHIPLFTYKYTFQGNPYTAVVEAATGGVLANIYPVKPEAPYLLIGILTALVFLCLATFPVGGALANEGEGAAIGLALCAGAGLVVAPILFGLAVWVAAKI